MAGFDNDTVYANNADFSVAGAGGGEATNGLQTNGQLWVGTTALNAGGTHINVLTLTPGTGISITQAATTLTIGAAGSLATTYTENSGNATPAGNNLNLFGTNSALTGYSPWTTGTGSTVTLNMPGTVKWVVNATTGLGTHTTIQAAITAASSGDDVFITAGTYTENLTLKVGVNLVAFDADSTTPNVTIIGTCTLTTAGTVSISGIRLQTNSAALLAVTGSAASIVNLNSCYLNCSNTTGITFSSSSGSAAINCNECLGDIGTAGISLFAHSSNGTLLMNYCRFTNSGSATTASTMSGVGIFQGYYCYFKNVFSTSGTTAAFSMTECILDTGGLNTTSITHNSTNAVSSTINKSFIAGGSASAISIGAGAGLSVKECDVSSSNTNAITGSGTLTFGDITFSGTSSTINTTTQTSIYTNLGKYRATGQPAFMAYNSSVRSNVTGDGTVYTLIFDTEITDQDNNFDGTSTFTAPITGMYQLNVTILGQGLTIAENVELQILANGTTYKFNDASAFAGNNSYNLSVCVPITAAGTAVAKFTVSGGTKTVSVFGGAGDPRTMFSGHLVA